MADGNKDAAGVVAPPPLIFLGFLALGLGLDHFWHQPMLPAATRHPLAAALIAASALLAVAGAWRLRRHGTTISPHGATTALVTDGVFAYSRNPLYVALTLLYAGVAVGADGLWILVLLVPALLAIRYGVVAREERYLEGKFGDAYRTYRSRVRRWL